MPDGTLAGSACAPALPSVLTAGVDWLTATSKAPDLLPLMLRRAGAIIARERIRGMKTREWRWNGYRGVVIPECAYGVRHDGGIVRISGALAHRWWHQIATRAERITRLDVEVTVGGVEVGVNLAGLARAGADRWRPANGRPSEWTYILTKSHGATCYLGSRASTRYARLYDKGAEEGGPHLSGRWRYEFEAKAEVAQALAPALIDAPSPQAAIIAVVHDHFSQRGVSPVFSPQAPAPAYVPAKVPTDVERWLRYLERNVGPTWKKYARLGHEAAMLQALGVISDAGRPATSGPGADGHWQSISPAAPYWKRSRGAGGK